MAASACGALFRSGPLGFAKRHAFPIDADGRIARVYRNIDPRTNSAQLIQDLQALRGRLAPLP